MMATKSRERARNDVQRQTALCADAEARASAAVAARIAADLTATSEADAAAEQQREEDHAGVLGCEERAHQVVVEGAKEGDDRVAAVQKEGAAKDPEQHRQGDLAQHNRCHQRRYGRQQRHRPTD